MYMNETHLMFPKLLSTHDIVLPKSASSVVNLRPTTVTNLSPILGIVQKLKYRQITHFY